jgi:hypothetical protein
VSQHASLSPERWRQFTPDQRLLMIANEMLRVASSFAPEHAVSRTLGYERVLRLTDLTIALTERRGLRRELLRWRDLVAQLFLGEADPEAHAQAFRALLLLSPAGAEQLRALQGRL